MFLARRGLIFWLQQVEILGAAAERQREGKGLYSFPMPGRNRWDEDADEAQREAIREAVDMAHWANAASRVPLTCEA